MKHYVISGKILHVFVQGARLQIKDKIQLSSQGNEPRRDEKYTLLFLHHSELQMPSGANHQTEDHKNEESTATPNTCFFSYQCRRARTTDTEYSSILRRIGTLIKTPIV